MSKGVDISPPAIFTAVCTGEGLPEPVPEYVFDETGKRKFRFDFAFVKEKIAVEFEGIIWFGNRTSRHQTAKGYEKDCEKYNLAVKQGWRVLRYPQRLQHQVVEDLRGLLSSS